MTRATAWVGSGLVVVALSILAACGGNTGSTDATCKNLGFGSGFVYDQPSLTIKKGGCVNMPYSPVHPLEPTTGSNNPIPTQTGIGATVKVIFAESGTFGYHCSNHFSAGMVGKIIVE